VPADVRQTQLLQGLGEAVVGFAVLRVEKTTTSLSLAAPAYSPSYIQAAARFKRREHRSDRLTITRDLLQHANTAAGHVLTPPFVIS